MKQEQITQNIDYVEISQLAEGLDGFIFMAKDGTIYYMKRIGEKNEIISPRCYEKWMANAQGKTNNTLYFDAEEHVFIFSFKDNYQISQSKVHAFEIDKETADLMCDAYNKDMESLYPNQSFAKSHIE